MKTFIEKIIEDNKDSFTEDELRTIEKNILLVKKIYLIGLSNGRDIYK